MAETDRDTADEARTFDSLFRQVYLTFHRRDGRRSVLSGASRAALLHLAITGPLTVGETAIHLERAQSVVSDLISQLEGHGLVEREPDPGNRRRTLVWLTAAGRDALERDRQVLATELLGQALARLDPTAANDLLGGLRRLLTANDEAVVGRIPPGNGHERSREEPS